MHCINHPISSPRNIRPRFRRHRFQEAQCQWPLRPVCGATYGSVETEIVGFQGDNLRTRSAQALYHGDLWENLQKPWFFYVLLPGFLMKWECLLMGSPCFLAETKSTMPRSSKTKKKCWRSHCSNLRLPRPYVFYLGWPILDTLHCLFSVH